MQGEHAPNTSRERDFNDGARPAANDAARAPDARAMSAELERLRRLYEGLLDSTPDLAYVWDLDHRFVYANRGLLAMWGKTWDEAIGKTCLELGYEPWHAEMHSREIEQVIATKAPLRGVVPFTGTFGRRIYDYLLVPVLGPDGEVEAVAGTTRDVTELKATEEALRESDQRKDEFIATLAHELSNPLAPLSNCLSILCMDDAGQVDRHKLHEVMERQVAQLVHLVGQAGRHAQHLDLERMRFRDRVGRSQAAVGRDDGRGDPQDDLAACQRLARRSTRRVGGRVGRRHETRRARRRSR